MGRAVVRFGAAGVAPDERLLAASPLTADPGTTADVSLRDELATLADPTIWIGLGAHPGTPASE